MAVCLCLLSGIVPVAQAATGSDQAVAYQIDPAHDGFQPADQLNMPLGRLWSVSLPGSISYPLIADGVVYVTAAEPVGYGTTLYAISLNTGATLWSVPLGGVYNWSALAYDAGRVFAINASGQLSAYDATTGVTDWSVNLPGQYMFSSPPTATGGYVYVGGAGTGGTLYAVSETTGVVAWMQSVMNGDSSSPAVGPDGVYVTYACDQDYGFNPLTGALLWHHQTSCEGGGGETPVLADGYLFSRDLSLGNVILSAATGSQAGTFASTTTPAVANGVLYSVNGGALMAQGSDGFAPIMWTFSGDGQLDSAPIVGGDVVYERSATGMLYALDAQTGALLWSGDPGAAQGNGPSTGIALGEQTLVVPAGTQLVAYRGASPPVSTPVASPPQDQEPPRALGRPHVGLKIHANPGVWSPHAVVYAYQWLQCDRDGQNCSLISGATHRFYRPTPADLGLRLRVQVTASDDAGASAPVLSLPTRRVRPIPGHYRHGHHRHGHHARWHHHGHRRTRHGHHGSR